FFFSSRRRHTRSDRDWSSDVCSSDLVRYCVDVSAGPEQHLRYRQKTPKNAVRIAEVLLRAGADINAVADIYGGSDTLGLAATSRSEERRVGKEGRWGGASGQARA